MVFGVVFAILSILWDLLRGTQLTAATLIVTIGAALMVAVAAYVLLRAARR